MKNILVCGASKGIGKACAKELAQDKHRLFLLARSEVNLMEVKKELENTCETYLIPIDVNNKNELKEQIHSVLNKYGPIEILVCNTGGPKSGAILDAHENEFLQAFHNHVLTNLELTKLIIPGMKEKNFGRIINIISTSVKSPIPQLGVSNTIRAAVASWAKTLSNEVAPFGITVNNVLPGYTNTDRLKNLIEKASERDNLTLEVTRKKWEQSVPAKRFGQPEEIAHAVAFLASEKASYINGINLPVDGGRTQAL